ncbi:MAG: TRAP transporter large permease [Proteobacteria bacterium]|nr:TRAP transporter large permease [Pseudomonadota bacterium]
MTVGLMVVLFFTFLALGLPIAYCMGLSAIVTLLVEGQIPPLLLAQQFYSSLDNFALLAVPLFILAGELMNVGGITERLVGFTRSLLGHIKGGLAHANILTNMFMAAISGSAAADAAAIGSMMIPAMKRDGYRTDFAVAVTASAALMGPIIPPSIVAVIYGSITGISIGALLLAGAVPGVIAGFLMMLVAWLMADRVGGRASKRATLKELVHATLRVLPAAVMPTIILGGIVTGAFTPTEAAAVAAFYGLVFGLISRRFTRESLYDIFSNAALVSASALITLAGAGLFSWVLARAGTAEVAIKALATVTTDPQLALLIILAFLLFLGSLVETVPALILSAPVLQPIVKTLGYDPVHFGCLVLMILVVGAVMPPVGIVAMICCRIGGIAYARVFTMLLPFVGVWCTLILLVAYVPILALWLPHQLR